MTDYIPRRVPGGYFKPHPETVWPSPDAVDTFRPPMNAEGKDAAHSLDAGWCAYVNLLTHPCGVDMLKSARRGWKALVKQERANAP